MASEEKDAIDAAIHTAETLFANLLDRANSSASLSFSQSTANELDYVDPESSLVPPNQSLTTIGAASLDPAHLTAQSHATVPIELDKIDPRESLTAMASRVSVESLSPPTYDAVCKMLKERERDVELAAKIGQTLLKRNELLEADLSSCVDQKQLLEQEVAQLRHSIGQKDELLKLYARDAHEKELAAGEGVSEGGEGGNPGWIQALAEECRELRESNLVLKAEALQLRKETADIEHKEKELVQNCLEQFTEAKRRLNELREELDSKQRENSQLQINLQELGEDHHDQLSKHHQLMEDADVLREQLADAQSAQSQLTNEVNELQERYQETSVLLKEAREELTALKQINSSTENGEHNLADQESIVREIEEVLRQELIAASTLPERPRSPNHYARQRTMVVMETVRAATLATARRLERLATEPEMVKVPLQDGKGHVTSTQGSAGTSFSPIAASSPGESRAHRNMATSTGIAAAISPTSPHPRAPSPIFSEAGSTLSLPDEMIRYRNQSYVAPEKLQIVKPMEGSVTLLKWKLLATPQLGGATTFFSDASRPGVHLKKWKAGGVVDRGHNLTVDVKAKSRSTNDLSVLNSSFPPTMRGRGPRREHSRTKTHQLATSTTPGSAGVNQAPGLVDDKALTEVEESKKEEEEQNSSLLGQVGSLIGSGWSKLASFTSSKRDSKPPSSVESKKGSVEEHTDSGLAGLL